MPKTPPSLPRSPRTLFVRVGLFGVVCFFAGRFSSLIRVTASISRDAAVPPAARSIAAKESAASVATERHEHPPSADAWSSLSDEAWHHLLASPATPARNAALADLIEPLGAAEPAHAIALAEAETNSKLRAQLVQAALHGWARTAPFDAAHWALAQATAVEREEGLSTVFSGAVAADADAALRLGQALVREYPDDAPSFGNRLIDACCAAGKFDIATHMAAGGDPELRAGWMATAYSKWAEYQPEQAASAANAIPDLELRKLALHGIVGGWGAVNPAALVAFALQLPPESDQAAILSQSLEYWVKRDPQNAAAWIDRNENRPELDPGVAAVATMPGIKADVALTWAESISNPQLRSETLVMVVRNWLTSDPAGARNYFKATAHLLPADRQQLDDVFAGLDRH